MTVSKYILNNILAAEQQITKLQCCICYNAGGLYDCDGGCLRAFHVTVEAGAESKCESLGFTEDEINAIPENGFFCKNCQYRQHQCFGCGELGSSDNRSSKPKVFECSNDETCGHFYHPRCVANLLHGDNVAKAKDLEEGITRGEAFTCPYHKCHACQRIENVYSNEFQFAVCMRCPTSYHRACLPSGIAFAAREEEGIVIRAWENRAPLRVLMFCLQHEIDAELGTPPRDHIKFP